MLDLDLDLEADLGIDTVKQAEMFASVRAAFDIPRDQTMRLRDFPTLGHVIRFAQERARGSTAGCRPPAGRKYGRDGRDIRGGRHAFRARVPVPVLRPATGSVQADRRIARVRDARFSSCRTGAVSEKRWPRNSRARAPRSWRSRRTAAAGPVNGVFWLPALDLTRADWREMTPAAGARRLSSVKSLYRTMRSLYDQIASAGHFPGFGDAPGRPVTATTMPGAIAPLGGAVTGFTKAYKRERPDALVKAVDFEPDRTPREIADLLIDGGTARSRRGRDRIRRRGALDRRA